MTGRFFSRAVKGLVKFSLSDSLRTLPRLSILPILFTLAGKRLKMIPPEVRGSASDLFYSLLRHFLASKPSSIMPHLPDMFAVRSQVAAAGAAVALTIALTLLLGRPPAANPSSPTSTPPPPHEPPAISCRGTWLGQLFSHERRVFSQNREDGATLAILEAMRQEAQVPIREYYVEFGTEDGTEINTRFMRCRHGQFCCQPHPSRCGLGAIQEQCVEQLLKDCD